VHVGEIVPGRRKFLRICVSHVPERVDDPDSDLYAESPNAATIMGTSLRIPDLPGGRAPRSC
jgi:hypothetical protein